MIYLLDPWTSLSPTPCRILFASTDHLAPDLGSVFRISPSPTPLWFCLLWTDYLVSNSALEINLFFAYSNSDSVSCIWVHACHSASPDRTIWPSMNPADAQRLYSEVTAHASALQEQERRLTSMGETVQASAARHDQRLEALYDQVQQLVQICRPPAVSQPAIPPVRAAPGPEPRLNAPDRFSGAPGTCRSFLTLCSLTFELQPLTYPTERSRVACMITQLSGRAREWGTAEWEKQSAICSSVSAFSEGLRKVFDHATPGREAARGLLNLTQGTRRVVDYSIDFQTIAAGSEWNASALRDAFHNGLSDVIKDELAARDPPADLDALIATSIRIDGRLQERRQERAGTSSQGGRLPSPPPGFPSASITSARGAPAEPMQLGRTRLSSVERQRRLVENCCMYCGQGGHYVSSCPVKDQAHQRFRGRW